MYYIYVFSIKKNPCSKANQNAGIIHIRLCKIHISKIQLLIFPKQSLIACTDASWMWILCVFIWMYKIQTTIYLHTVISSDCSAACFFFSWSFPRFFSGFSDGVLSLVDLLPASESFRSLTEVLISLFFFLGLLLPLPFRPCFRVYKWKDSVKLIE